MYLSHLSLTNFRIFRELEVDFSPGVVVLFGGNAAGKTTLLEAIYLLAIAKSFRADNEKEVVSWGAASAGDSSLVAATIETQGERVKVYVGYQPTAPQPSTPTHPHSTHRAAGLRKQIRVSRVKRTAAELVGVVNAVLFSADDIELVQGPRPMRRRYLDILIAQVDQLYLRSLQRYQRVLQQRNRLLRLLQEKRAGTDELEYWDQELVNEGSTVLARRYEAMAALFPLCREKHADLVGSTEDLIVEYRPSVPLNRPEGGKEQMALDFAAALEISRARELAVGSTTVGPHRDDFALLVNGVDMGTYASRGQARTMALALRLAEAAYLDSMRGEAPIVLLDDVLSELDSLRRTRVLEKALEYQQVIISTTNLEPILHSPYPTATYYEVKGGGVFLDATLAAPSTPAHPLPQ